MQQLRVTHLEQHASDPAGQLRVHLLDQREETLSQHLFLFLGQGSSQHAGGEGGLARDDHLQE